MTEEATRPNLNTSRDLRTEALAYPLLSFDRLGSLRRDARVNIWTPPVFQLAFIIAATRIGRQLLARFRVIMPHLLRKESYILSDVEGRLRSTSGAYRNCGIDPLPQMILQPGYTSFARLGAGM